MSPNPYEAPATSEPDELAGTKSPPPLRWQLIPATLSFVFGAAMLASAASVVVEFFLTEKSPLENLVEQKLWLAATCAVAIPGIMAVGGVGMIIAGRLLLMRRTLVGLLLLTASFGGGNLLGTFVERLMHVSAGSGAVE